MIVYNVTYKVDDSIEREWFDWMEKVHVPAILDSKLFKGYTFSRLVGQETAYTLQLYLGSMREAQVYTSTFLPGLKAEVDQKYGDKVLSFRTLMEVVHSTIF